MRPFWVLVGLMLLQASAPSIRLLDKGPQSSVHAVRQVAVRTEVEWRALWNEHAPTRPLPAVDFARELVVGVFLGNRPTAGYSVDIAAVREEQGGLVVQYRESRPGPDRITAQVLTAPYQLVAVPARAGTVRFEQTP